MSKLTEVIKQNSLYWIARFFADSKEQPVPVRTIECSSNQVRYYANTPNTIIFYDNGNEKGFFRECRKHESKRQYLEKLIKEYCSYVYVNEHSLECEKILCEKLKSTANFNRFFYMGAGTASFTRITKFRKTLDSEWIGISKPYPEWFENQLLQLVQYAWGALEEYKYNSFLKIGKYHIYNANRSIATKKIADVLGGNDLVPKTEYIELIIDGEKRIGVSVDVAKGLDPTSMDIIGVTPQFQKETIHLNIIDAICHQRDHRPGNYFVETDSNKYAVSLCAFDNDCPTTLMPFGKADFVGYIGYSSIIKDGLFYRPFISKECYQKLMSASKKDFRQALASFASKSEIFAVIIRFEQVKKAVEISVQIGFTKVLEDSEWTENTIEKEMCGQYGESYLKYFVDKICKK